MTLLGRTARGVCSHRPWDHDWQILTDRKTASHNKPSKHMQARHLDALGGPGGLESGVESTWTVVSEVITMAALLIT